MFLRAGVFLLYGDKMIVSITINLSNYENMKISSSEHETFEGCKEELLAGLREVNHERAEIFANVFK